MLLRSLIRKSGISDEYIIETENRFTNAYCKPMRHGISATVYEDPRLDFENRCAINEDTENKVIEYLRKLAEKVNVLCVADQFRYGIVTDKVREEIISLAKKGLTVICDSRYNIGKYTDCILKPNEVEAALDDVNVTRYAQYVRRMTENTQFILITHRRGTMDEADMLYGVTMQEKGVSKLLELKTAEMAKKLGLE